MKRGIACITLLATLAGSIPAQPASAQVTFVPAFYISPVTSEVVDPFRPPAHIGATGNRGLEYGTVIDEFVMAAADGFVTFSGPVVGRNIITLLHSDNVRTTYTGLTELWAYENQHVKQGDVIGRADVGFHFGARSGAHYLDPQILIEASTPEQKPRLVPPPIN